ncbi:MAG: polysaccharide biosynthesis tyrosine autokinase [Bryobacteraceae bacterium]
MYHAPDSNSRQLTLANGAAQAPVPQRLVYLEPYEAPAAASVDSPSTTWEFIQLLRARKWTLLLFALAGIGLAGLVSLKQTPIYLARTTLELHETGQVLGTLKDMAAGEGRITPEAYLSTQVKVLQSTSLRRRVEQRLRTGATEQDSNGLLPPIPSLGSGPSVAAPAPTGDAKAGVPSATAAMASTGPTGAAPAPAHPKPWTGELPEAETEIKSFGSARILEILCESPDAHYAADFANTMAEEYIQSSMEARWGVAQRTSTWLNRQLAEMRAKLEQSEAQLQNYQRSAGLVITDEQGKDNVAEEKLRQLQAEYSRAEAERVAKQSVYEVAMSAAADTVPQVIDDGRLSGYHARIAELKRELAEKSAALTPAHPQVIRLNAQIGEMETTLRRERANIIARIKNDYDAAARREKMLEDSYRRQMQNVSDNSTKSIYYGLLKREVETNRRLYDELLQKMKELSIGQALPTSNIRVLDPADVPYAPYKPRHAQNMALGLAAGLILGCLFVFTSDHVNRSLKAPGEASYYLKVPELGVIPSSEAVAPAKLPKIDTDNGFMPLQEGVNGAWSANGAGSVELITWQDRPSVVAESYRSTLASILAARGLKDRPRVILVTSVDRGEGKSTTVSNLGIALAEINQRVLLLDADLRKPHLHKIFNLPNAWGLSNLLRERISLKDSPIEALVKPTDIENLYLLPSGPGTVSIANLLYSNRMAELIDRLRGEFDTVIIDTPPMLYLSDARVLGRLADGAILVLRAGKTTRDAAMIAKQRLNDDGIHILGTVLNGWNPKDKNRYGYYRYNYTSDNS